MYKQQIIDLYQKEYKDELTSLKNQNQIEIDKLLSTTNVQTYTSGSIVKNGKRINFKKTRVIDNGKDIGDVKKSEVYLSRVSRQNDLQNQLDNIATNSFEDRFESDFQKYNKMYVDDITSRLIETEKWLKNKQNSLNYSITHELSKSIISKNQKDYDNLFNKVENLKEQLSNISNDDIHKFMYKILNDAYNVRVSEKKKGEKLTEKGLHQLITKSRHFISDKRKANIDNVYKKDRQDRKSEKYLKKSQDRSYRYFCKQLGYFPHYLKKKLKNMPCNTGYKFNGIDFYGLKPSDGSNKTTLLEKKGKNLFIHEYEGENYTLKQTIRKTNKRGKKYNYNKIIKKEKRKSKIPVLNSFSKIKAGSYKEKKLDDISFNAPTNVVENVWSNRDLSNIKRQEEFTISEEVLRHKQVLDQKEKERLVLLVEKQQEKEQNRLVAYFGPEDDYFSDEE